MNPILKARTFSDYLQDTIDFFKLQGKTFFTNYLKLTGVLLIITIGFNLIITSTSLDLFTNLESGDIDDLEVFSPLNVLSIIGLIFIGLIVTIITWLYPIFVLKGKSEPLKKELTLNDYKHLIKKNALRSIGFFILSSLLGAPVLVILFSLSIVLVVIIIGIPLLLLIFPVYLSLFNLAFYEYTINKTSFFDSYSVAFNMLKKNFVPIVANTCIVLILMSIAMGIPAISMQGLQLAYILEGQDGMVNQSPGIIMQLAFLVCTVALALINYLFYCIFIVNQGMVYFSEIDRRDNNQVINLIDSIGNPKNE